MPLNLADGCKARLRAFLKDQLPKVRVRNNMIIDHGVHLFKADNTILPVTGKSRERLNALVSEFPFSDFISDTLSSEFATREWIKNADVPLTWIEGYQDTAAVATRLVEAFDELPYQYELTVPLPDSVGDPLLSNGAFSISDTIRVVRLDASFKERFQTSDVGQMPRGLYAVILQDGLRLPWPSQAAALQLSCEGYFSQYGQSEPYQEALRAVESILGMCIALNYVSVSRQYQTTPPRFGAYVHRKTDDGFEPHRHYWIDSVLAQQLQELEPRKGFAMQDVDRKRVLIAQLQDQLHTIYSDPAANKQLITAAQWLFNSHVGNNPLLTFIQATIVLEILLGDEAPNEKLGLAELLRNRCAYLVATNRTEREDLKKLFTQIYEVRSKIVHRGLSKLTSQELVLLARLRQLGHRVIQREVRLLP